MRFATDATLGKLGRHLRAAGFDTLCQHQVRRAAFFDSIDPGRIILTRTTALRTRYRHRRLIFVRNNDPKLQMRQVVRELGLRRADTRPLTRCLVCNGALERVEKEHVAGMVPVYVWYHQHTFLACGGCRRIYWAGTHRDRMQTWLDTLFEQRIDTP